MRAELLCSCGLALISHGKTLLIDVPNENLPPFFAISEEKMREILKKTGVFSQISGLIFTHLHSDHYDAALAEAVSRAHPDARIYLPNRCEPEQSVFTAGPFTIERHRFAHTPAPKFPDLPHDVLLISDGEKLVYVTADAAPDAEAHRRILNGRTADAAFWNSQYLSYPETRALLRGCAGVSYIYHMPVDDADVSGIRRKCERNMQRFGAELPNVRVLTHYPSILDI